MRAYIIVIGELEQAGDVYEDKGAAVKAMRRMAQSMCDSWGYSVVSDCSSSKARQHITLFGGTWIQNKCALRLKRVNFHPKKEK